MMKITDPKLFKAIETALASGNTVYLTSPDYQSTGDGPELIRNSTLIKGKPGELPADFFHSVNSDQFLRVLKRYARFECEACGRSCRDEYYMLRSELWPKVCRSNDLLCIGCVEDRLGRKLVPMDFDLEETFASAMQFPPAWRLKHRLGVSWDKRLNRVLAVICAQVLALSAKFLSVTRRARTADASGAPKARTNRRQIELTCLGRPSERPLEPRRSPVHNKKDDGEAHLSLGIASSDNQNQQRGKKIGPQPAGSNRRVTASSAGLS